MQVGISTASLFIRKNTEDALEFLAKNSVDTAEVFLESYCEYNEQFGKLLKSVQGNTSVHSVHVLTTQFEPQLYSVNERAKSDSFKILDGVLDCANQIGAKNYTFHGVARLKRIPYNIDFSRVGKITQELIDKCKSRGVSLAYENVHWAYYNYVGFFTELKKHVKGLKATLDVKQARQSNLDYRELIKEMGRDLVTVHLSDVDKEGKMCLPGRGVTDFKELFSRLNDVGFNGSAIIEAYQSDYGHEKELLDSLGYLNSIK